MATKALPAITDAAQTKAQPTRLDPQDRPHWGDYAEFRASIEAELPQQLSSNLDWPYKKARLGAGQKKSPP